MTRIVRMASLAAAGILLTGCAATECKRPTYYLGAGSSGQLVIPEGVTAPDTRSSLKIPADPGRPVETGEDSPCLEAPPAYFDQSGAVVGSPEALVYAWAEAMGQKNVDNLQALYSDFFSPAEGHLAAWREQKERQMQELGDARVVVDKLSMAPAPGGRMVARFVQRIQAGSAVTEKPMELVLSRDNNAWAIISEKN